MLGHERLIDSDHVARCNRISVIRTKSSIPLQLNRFILGTVPRRLRRCLVAVLMYYIYQARALYMGAIYSSRF